LEIKVKKLKWRVGVGPRQGEEDNRWDMLQGIQHVSYLGYPFKDQIAITHASSLRRFQ